MAYFAKLDESNVVLEIHTVHNNELLDENGAEQEQKGIDFLTTWSGGYPHWKQCSYNKRIRKNYPAIGYTYDAARDAFIPPKPYDDAVFDEATCQWIVPEADSVGADSV